MMILLYIFIFFTFIQFLYYLLIFNKLVFYKNKFSSGNKDEKIPVSIIICAQDESENLKAFLPKIYEQNYPDFQIVLVDDRSIDDTFDVMQSFKDKYPNQTYVVHIENSNDRRFVGNKKYALTMGIKGAKYEHLLFTDADCEPASKDWISIIASRFASKKQLVLGYGKYQNIQNSFLNKIIRYETLQTALQYFSYALKGIPYMGVGRNLAYTKKLFMDNNGFYSHLDILSGDDDLFVNEVATPENTAICIEPAAFTLSKPKTSWKEFIHQKRRHIATADHYKWKHRILLATYYAGLIGFYALAILLLIKQLHWQIVMALVVARFLYWFFINYKTMQKLDEKGLILYLPVLEVTLLLFQFYIFILNLFKKPTDWTV